MMPRRLAGNPYAIGNRFLCQLARNDRTDRLQRSLRLGVAIHRPRADRLRRRGLHAARWQVVRHHFATRERLDGCAGHQRAH